MKIAINFAYPDGQVNLGDKQYPQLQNSVMYVYWIKG